MTLYRHSSIGVDVLTSISVVLSLGRQVSISVHLSCNHQQNLESQVLLLDRDSNQLLLLLRHLYTHLPGDAAITLATEQRDLHVKHLMKLISAELCEKKRQARAVVAAGKVGIPPTGLPQPGTALGAVGVKDSNGSSPEVMKRESEEFAEQQRLYHHSRTQHVGREAVSKFEVAVQNCETETDTAVAKFKL